MLKIRAKHRKQVAGERVRKRVDLSNHYTDAATHFADVYLLYNHQLV